MYLDEKFVRIMGSRLAKFKPTGTNKYQCRCPLCGDSKKDKNKARGNFFVYRGDWLYKCHNCGKSMQIPTMLESVFPDLYDEYIMGKFQEKIKPGTANLKRETIEISDEKVGIETFTLLPKEFTTIPKLSDLPDTHHAVIYAKQRKIPDKYLLDLYYAESFMVWSNTIVEDAFKNTTFDSDRLVIPFRDKNGYIFAFQGRAFGKTKLKYLTTKIDKDAQKIYGLDRVDLSKPVYVLEGPIDSMFLQNALGCADSSLASLKDIADDVTFIWDNEPRSKEIVATMERAINLGCSVVIWNKSDNFNDINHAIKDRGYTIARIEETIKNRTFSGLDAQAELNNWRKV